MFAAVIANRAAEFTGMQVVADPRPIRTTPTGNEAAARTHLDAAPAEVVSARGGLLARRGIAAVDITTLPPCRGGSMPPPPPGMSVPTPRPCGVRPTIYLALGLVRPTPALDRAAGVDTGIAGIGDTLRVVRVYEVDRDLMAGTESLYDAVMVRRAAGSWVVVRRIQRGAVE